MTGDRLIAYFHEQFDLSEEEVGAIRDSLVIRSFPKHTIVLQAGQISTECYFVLKGCIRQYYLVEGEEITDQFFTEDHWVVSMASFSDKVPAPHYWSCSEDCILVVGKEDTENDLYRRFPRFEMISRTVMGKMLARQQELSASYLTDSPEQRYLKLLKTRPDLLQRVPQYHIASYIGVKPESLSRIRKRLVSGRH